MSQSNGFKVVALNVDTNKTQNLELLLDAADFEKNSSRWKTLSIKSYTKPWDPNRFGSGLHVVMAKVSSKYLLKSSGVLPYKIDADVQPQFSK